MQVEILQAKTADINLIVQMIEVFYEHEKINFNYEKQCKVLSELISENNYGRIFLVKMNDDLAGYFVLTNCYSLEFNGRFLLLDELYIKPEFRKLGIASKIIDYCKFHCMQNKISALRLEVDFENSNAYNLYSKLGFVNNNRNIMTYYLQ